MTTVSGTERIVHIYVSIRCKSLCKFFLTFLHFFLGCVICGIFLVNAYGLAFFFRVEAEVFKQEHLTGLQSGGLFSCLGAVFSKLYFSAEIFANCIFDLAE